MSNPTPIPNEACPRTNRLVTVLTVLTLLFVANSGLIPYNTSEAAARGSRELFGTSISRFTIPDIVSNIFLYLPVGAMVYWSFRRRIRNVFGAILLTLLVGTALSLLIEWIQSFMPVRVSSLIDLVCNIIGTAIGTAVSCIARWMIPKIADASARELRARPLVFATKAYCAVLIVSAAMPFSLSLDGGLVKRSLRMVTTSPFGAFKQLQLEASDAIARRDMMTFSYAQWSSLKHWSRWAMETTAFAIFGWLVVFVLVAEMKFPRRGASALALWLGLLMALGMSGLQIFIISRDVDVTDIIFRMLGCVLGLGYVLSSSLRNPHGIVNRAPFNPRRIARFGVTVFLAYVVYTGLIPLCFNDPKGGFTASLTAPEVLPFFGYFVTRFDFMMDDVLEKSAAYLALGAFLACGRMGKTGSINGSAIAKIGAIGAIIALPMEIVQMYMPVRVASLGDLLIAGIGCAIGATSYRYLHAACRSTLEDAPLELAAMPTHTDASGRLTPLDEILSTLAEPHPDAPKEPGTTRPSTPQT